MTEHEKTSMKIKPSKRERHETSYEKLAAGVTGVDWRSKGVLGPVVN
jgi:hypothetical protein